MLYFLFEGGFMKRYMMMTFLLALFYFGVNPEIKVYAMGRKKEKVQKKDLPSAQPATASVRKVDSRVDPEEILLSESNVTWVYKDIIESIKNAGLRRYHEEYRGEDYEVFAGEILNVKFPQTGEYSAEVVKSPYLSDSDVVLKGEELFFKNGSQGEYIIEVTKDGSFYKRLRVISRVKYSFTQEKNYDIILNSYENGKLDLLISSVKLSRIAFPNALYHKKSSFMLLDQALTKNEFLEAKEAVDFIRKNFQLDEMDQENLLYSEMKILKSDPVKYKKILEKNSNNPKAATELLNLILDKKILTDKEVLFLESRYEETQDEKIALHLGRWYMNNGDIINGEKYLAYGKDYYNLCMLYLKNQDIERFELVFEKVSEEKRSDLLMAKDLYDREQLIGKEIQLGDEEYQAEDYEEAVLFYKRAEIKDRKAARGLGIDMKIGKSYYYIFQYTDAVNYFQKAMEVEKNPIKRAEIYYLTGMCYYRLEDKERSMESFERLVKEYPETTWSKKAVIYIVKLR